MREISEKQTDAWIFWNANGGFQVGRGLWLGRKVDYWLGSIGTIITYSGVLTVEEIKQLYANDLRSMSLVFVDN